jgi:PAS domain S-box-containing protein
MTPEKRDDVNVRAKELFHGRLQSMHRDTDRMFAVLMVLQFVVGVLLALVVSPRAWAGSSSSPHFHLYLALFLGGAISSLPIVLALNLPGTPLTRHVIAVGQTLWSALLIHLTGGRIETHFHIFGSLAFLAFYREVPVLITAAVVVAADHLVRGLYAPQSMYGILTPSNWRWLEHATWVVFEGVVLVRYCLHSKSELFEAAQAQAKVEGSAHLVERQVIDRTRELQSAHGELEVASRFLTAVFQAVPGGLFVFDERDRIKATNEGVAQLLEYEESELIGQPVSLLFGGDAPTFAAIERGGQDPLRAEKVCRSKSGVSIPVLFSARPLKAADDVTSDVVCVALDIRERKKLEVQLRQTQKLESLGQLAAGIAHEINTPTQFVSDNTRFLQSSFDEILPLLEACSGMPARPRPGPEMDAFVDQVLALAAAMDLSFVKTEIPKALEDSLAGLDHISGIVRAMKEFSHPGSRSKELVDLNHCVESTVMVARNEWKYLAELHTDLALDLPHISCFPQDVNQVLLNMIVNAAHAIGDMRKKRGGEELGRIDISTRAARGAVEIRIRDNGCGIPEAIRGRIFDPFFTTKEVGKGTGQGLAIAHNVVVEKHGGQIEVESEVGVGTTFIVTLPVSANPAVRAAA